MSLLWKVCNRFVVLFFVIMGTINVLSALDRCRTTEEIDREILAISPSNTREINAAHQSMAMKGIEYVSNIVAERIKDTKDVFSEGGVCGSGVESLLTLLSNCLYDISLDGDAGKILLEQNITVEKYEDLERKFGRMRFGYY